MRNYKQDIYIYISTKRTSALNATYAFIKRYARIKWANVYGNIDVLLDVQVSTLNLMGGGRRGREDREEVLPRGGCIR